MAPVRTLGGITGLDSPVLTPRVCPVPDALWLSAGVLLPPLTRPLLSSSQPWAPGPGPAGPVAAALWPVSVPRCCDVLHPSAVRELYNGLLHFLYGSPPVAKSIAVRWQARGPLTGGHLATSEVDVEMILSYKLFERFFVAVSASLTT